MASPLEGSLAKAVGSAMAALFLPAVLTRDVPTAGGDPFDPPPPTPQAYPCRAIVERYAERFRVEGLVQQNERKVLVLANGLTVRPQPGDRITIRGITFTAIDVGTDPAEAVWEIKGAM